MPYKSKKHRGFTILEMMSAVMVLAVLATMSVLGFRKAINQQKLVGETNTAAAALKYIGSEARVRKQQYRVRVDFDKNEIIGWVDKNSNGVFDAATEQVFHKWKAPPGVDVYTGFISVKKISGLAYFNFLPDGKSSLEATLVIRGTKTGKLKTIQVNPQSGWVEVFEGAPSSLATGGTTSG